ncbi:MAG: hypothetical protein IJA32_06925 [Lachnospiraceae bacterium]|nr:hypothetical protein [Lachnospiraceae bacterium]
MKHEDKWNQILKQALSPEEKPNEWLNQNILRRAKENEKMTKRIKPRIPAAAMVAALTLCLGSATAFAAWKYLTPDEVAQVFEDQGLMKAFQSEDAITINESQTCGNMKITLLGMVSGKNLSQCMLQMDENVKIDGELQLAEDKTYIVTAIERVNSTEQTENWDEAGAMGLTVSPLVKGLNPWEFNIYTMDGGCMTVVENGIEYRITKCDNIEMFADRGLYLSVTDGAPSADAYEYNEETGEITRKESYEGVNALFSLPIDVSKADPEAAEQYLKELKEKLEDGDEDSQDLEEEGLAEELFEEMGSWTLEELNSHAEYMEDLTQILTPDEDGNITVKSFEMKEDGMKVGEVTISPSSYFEGKQAGDSVTTEIVGDGETYYIENYTMNEDGTFTLRVYRYVVE